MRPLRRVLVVAKRSAYDIYVRRHRSPRILDLLARNDPAVARLARADRHHARTLAEVHAAVSALGLRAAFRARDRVGDTSGFDLVVTVGGDGTLLWVSHTVADTPVLGINSAPMDSVGYLCGLRMGEVLSGLEALARGELPYATLARMKVSVDGVVQHRRVLNDALFAHGNPAMTSRYLLEFRGITEEHKASGVWIATPAGSTAAIRGAGGRVLSLRSRSLQFAVREPYTPTGESYAFVRGILRPGESLTLHNKLREAKVYLDGPRTVLSVEMGQRVSFELSDESLTLLGVTRRGAIPSLPSIPPP